MSQQSGQSDSSEDILVFIGLFLAALYGIYYAYSEHPYYFNLVFLNINKPLLYVFSLLPFGEAKILYEMVDWSDPERYSFHDMSLMSGVVGSYLRWPVVLFIAYLAYRSETKLGRAELFTAVHTMESLLQNNVKRFPCLAPIAWRKILDEPLDTGPWRLSRTALQFVAENNLLLDKNNAPLDKNLLIDKKTGLANESSPLQEGNNNKDIHLNKKKLGAILTEQMGGLFSSANDLPDYQKGLAAAFLACAAGDKKKGQALMDQMSLSFEESYDGSPIKIDISGADDLIEKYINETEIEYGLRNHTSFVNTWFMALLTLARKKGVICSSQFIWLRPTDRALFYSLNQIDGRRGWAESCGPWAHFNAEVVLQSPIFSFEPRAAIEGIEFDLKETGWIKN